MPGFLTGMQEGMGGGGGGGGDNDKKNKDQKTSLAQTIGKKIKGAIGIGKSSGGGGGGGPQWSTAETGWGSPKAMKKGGTVKKTGMIKMHKGEKVIPAKARRGKWASGGKKARGKR